MVTHLHRAIGCLTSVKIQYKCFSNEDNVVKLLENAILNPLKIESNGQFSMKYEQLKPLSKPSKRKDKQKKNEISKYMIPIVSNAFSDCCYLHPQLKASLNSMFEIILPIQQKVLPHACRHKSVLIQSETGSGKTIAFAAPVVNSLMKGKLDYKNRCLILCPTKQLCEQIYRVILHIIPKSSYAMLLKSVGSSHQNKQIIDGVPIIISTPGALNAKLQQGILKLSDITMVVVDEIDRLFEDDFENQITHIMAGLNNSRKEIQYLLSSATVSEQIKDKLKRHIKDLFVIKSGNITPCTLQHKCVLSPAQRRTETLLHLLSDSSKCIIFVQKKVICEGVVEVLRDKGYYATMIHGDMTEIQRDRQLQHFREGKYDIIVATDIIARGVDIPQCNLSIQIEPCVELDMYLHRAGRAARAGNSGTSYIIMSRGNSVDMNMIGDIRKCVDLEVIDSRDFLPTKPTGIKSVLESSLHTVNKSDELAISIDVQMEDSPNFYEQLVNDLNIRPMHTTYISNKKIFGIWFSSPVEAWSAHHVIQHYFHSHNLPLPHIAVFRHKNKQTAVQDWDSYFNNLRTMRAEQRLQNYRNLVKSQMNAKRHRKKKR